MGRAPKSPAPAPAAATFAGFTPSALAFLRELADNNDPGWFKPRRDDYERLLQAPMTALVADVMTEAARRRLPLGGEPHKALFRIHRDVRFSPDKRPYKTHVGAAMTRTGRKSSPGLLYVHIQPGGCFAAAGFWHPEPPLLDAFRRAVAAAPKPFLAIVGRLDRAGLPLEPDDESVKRLPRGFEAAKGSAIEPFLRRRNFVVRRHIAEAAVLRPDLAGTVVELFAAASPLLEFGWRVADTLRLE